MPHSPDSPPPRPPDTLHVWPPPPTLVRDAAVAASFAGLGYPEVGASRGPLPPGYRHDEASVVLGEGDLAFERARRLVRDGRMFQLPWISLEPARWDLRVGTPVPFVSRQLGLYALNVCTIVEVVDEDGHFAVAWGTPPGQMLVGEERFVVRRADDGQVRFTIRKFSRPGRWLARLAGPLLPVVQDRFSRDALAVVAAAMR